MHLLPVVLYMHTVKLGLLTRNVTKENKLVEKGGMKKEARRGRRPGGVWRGRGPVFWWRVSLDLG